MIFFQNLNWYLLKTQLKLLFGLLLIFIIAYVAYKFFYKQNNNIANNGKLIPNIQLQSIDNEAINLKFVSGKVKYLIFFDSFCEHCQAEANAIQKNIIEFEKAEIIFISIQKMRNINIFADEYNLKNISNVNFAQINPEVLSKEFGNMGFPTIFIYNIENELVDKISGEIKVEKLTKYLE